MNKWVKVTAAVVVVLLASALILPLALRGRIASVVKSEANRMLVAKLDFERLNISLLRHFPQASLELRGLTLIGADRFEGDTIVAADRVSVVVDLWSLFGDEGFEVTKVILSSPSLYAHRLADGAVNWEVMRPSDEEKPAAEKSEDEESSFRLSVRDLRIADARIRYVDDSTRMSFSTAPASLRLRGDLSAESTELSLQLRTREMRFVSGGIPLLSGAEAELEATIEADLTRNRFTFSENKLRLNAIDLALDGWVELRDDESIGVDLKAGCQRVQFKDVLSLIPAFYTREFRNLAASGELSMSLWTRGDWRDAQLPAFEVQLGVQNGSFQYSSLPKAVTDINLALRVANPGGVMDQTEVDLSRFGLKMAGNSVDATLYATHLVSDPLFRASLAGRVDLGAIAQVYPLEKGESLGGQIAADVKVAASRSDVEQNRYEQIAASGSFVVERLALHLASLPEVKIRRAAASITPQAMTLGEFALNVGASDLSANGQLTGYIGYLLHGHPLSGRLYVKSNLLDLNELMSYAPAPDSTEVQSTAAVAADTTATVHAMPIPANLSLSLCTELQKVLFQQMTINQIRGEMRVADQALSLDKLTMQLFDGQASASGSYSTAHDPQCPELRLDLSLAGASFVKTFRELEMVQRLVPIFARTGGDYSLSLVLAATLDSAMNPDLQTVNAAGEIRSANIRIQNLEVFDQLAELLANEELRQVEARDVAIRFVVRDGRLITQPFDLKMGGIHIEMSGSTGLDQSIDYTAEVALPGGGVIQKIPVRIGGTFADPKITLDAKTVAADAVKNVLDKQVQQLTGSESVAAEITKQAEALRSEATVAGEKLVAAAQAQRAKLIEGASSKGALAQMAAEKAGDKLVAEAEKQAASLLAEADCKIQSLTASAQ